VGFGLMRKLDKNHDGFLTREEFVDKLVEHVNVGDENKRLTLARQVVELSGRVHRYRQHDQHNRDTKDDVDESWRGDRAEHSAGGGVAAASSRRRRSVSPSHEHHAAPRKSISRRDSFARAGRGAVRRPKVPGHVDARQVASQVARAADLRDARPEDDGHGRRVVRHEDAELLGSERPAARVGQKRRDEDDAHGDDGLEQRGRERHGPRVVPAPGLALGGIPFWLTFAALDDWRRPLEGSWQNQDQRAGSPLGCRYT